MGILTENLKRMGAYLVSEASDMYRSREQVTISSGADLVAGTVLGKITASGKYAIHDPAAVDGTEAAAAILLADANAASADVRAVVHVRDCVVRGSGLTYITGISDANKALAIADLEAKGIIVR